MTFLKPIIAAFIYILAGSAYAQSLAQDTLTNNIGIDTASIYERAGVDKMATFENMSAFLEKVLEYPESARDSGKMGTVKIGFIVEKDGSLSNIYIVKTSGTKALDNEGLRVVKLMPKWTPAEYKGQKVRLKFILPIQFAL